ncbi:hypothetical protein ADL05_03600 [Nocardiopsis sp. NRRL B-16309]|nr:hypothetical protein ADL05_03600 [Nocardiopsis sp. NRRL B-16309]
MCRGSRGCAFHGLGSFVPRPVQGVDDGRSSIEAHGSHPWGAVSGDHYRGPASTLLPRMRIAGVFAMELWVVHA